MGTGKEFDFEIQWQGKLSSNLKKTIGQERAKIVAAGKETLSDASSGEELINWTKGMMERLESSTTETEIHDIMTGCACRYPEEELKIIRDEFRKTGSSDRAHALLQKEFEKSIRIYKQLEDEHMNYILERGMGAAGVKNGNTIIATKIPKDFKKYYESTDPSEKPFLYCHCPRIRSMLKEGKTDIPSSYCYCGAGFYRWMWEFVTDKPVRVEVSESILKGDDLCRIKIHLSE